MASSAQAISLLTSATTTAVAGNVTRFFQRTTTKSVKLYGNNCSSRSNFQLGMSIRKTIRDAPPAQHRLSSSINDTAVPSDAEDGVVLGTSKLPSNTDLFRFDSLLFQVRMHLNFL